MDRCSKKATIGWVGLGAYIGAYDAWACLNGHESLSGAFWRGLGGRKARIPILLGTVIVVKHLVAPKVLPQVDPLNSVGRRLRSNNDKIGVKMVER